MKTIRIIIIDDHKLIRDGLKSYFMNDESIKVVGEAAHGKEALEVLAKKKVDIALSDISMPLMDGIEFCAKALESFPKLKVIALSMHNEYQHIKAMLNAGASSYLLKNCGKDELLKAINAVYNDEEFQSPEVADVVMRHMMNKPSNSPLKSSQVTLTQREKEILHLVVKEYSNNEIADALNISIRTVNAHKGNLIEKTGAKNVVGLIMFALRNGLAD